jgi:hypothetical protein
MHINWVKPGLICFPPNFLLSHRHLPTRQHYTPHKYCIYTWWSLKLFWFLSLHYFYYWLNHMSQHLPAVQTFTYPRVLVGLGCQGKEIHSIPYDQEMCPRNLHTIWYICNSTAFCPTQFFSFVKPVFSEHFRKFLVTTPSAEMTKGYTDTLLSFQIFLTSGPNFHVS